MEVFLKEVARKGWNERRRRRFLALYGSLIRGSILYHVRRYFGPKGLRVLSEQLEALQAGKGSGATINWGVLDLVRDTWQDVLMEVFKEGGLIDSWLKHVAEKGKEARDFESYLKGAVQIKFFANLRKRNYSVESSISKEDYIEKNHFETLNGTLFKEEKLFYWDMLLRCLCPSPQEIERRLIHFERSPETILIWACACLKEKYFKKGEKGRLENLLAFITFFCSHSGPQRKGPLPSPQHLSIDIVAGRYFRWEEDVCRGIFKKKIRKDRIIRQIRDLIALSPYRDILGVQNGKV